MYPNQYCNPCHEPEPCIEVPAPPDCVGEPCEEIVLDTCVRYTGPAIPCLGILTGDSLNEVIQLIAAKLCDCCDGEPLPVNCVVSDWSEWSSCVDGVETRTRTIITAPSNGGTACPPLVETRDCCLPVNCVVSDWSEWSDCDELAIRTRTRTVITPASCGGTPCPILEEVEECIAPPLLCVPVTEIIGRSLDCETISVSFVDNGSATTLVAELVLASAPSIVLQSHNFVVIGTPSSYYKLFTNVTAGTYLIKVYKNDINGICDTVSTLSITVEACPIPECPAPSNLTLIIT